MTHSTRPSARLAFAAAACALAAGTAIFLALAGGAGSAHAAPPTSCKAPGQPLSFDEQTYVETGRAGGEPTVRTHPDGTLIYTAHAGTTHFFAPAVADEDSAAFVQNYRGQTYIWWSEDGGDSWTFVPRDLPPDGVAGSGFSDPEIGIDTAGQVYESEINLVNVAVSKSTDSARSFELQNFFGQVLHDRQWMEADEEDVLYMTGNSFAGGTFPTDPVGHVGHTLYKSTDGGQTFSPGIADGDGLGDIRVDQSDGTLYEAYLGGGVLSMAVREGAREDDLEAELFTIAEGVDMLSHWPAFDLDPEGNLYITWDESGDGDREAGIWYSYSTDRGRSWADPVRVDDDARTDIWPWLATGDDGRVAVAYLEADVELPDHNAETPGDHGWRVVAAQTLNGHGCGRSDDPGFRTAVATPDPVHTGTICQGGTICQAQGVDRRMGDYFTIDVDGEGRLWAGYADTRQGGAVPLPGFVRQDGGPSFHSRSKRR